MNIQHQVPLDLIDEEYYINVKYNKDKELVLTVEITKLYELLSFLRDHETLRFKILADIVGIDYVLHPESHKRFGVIYNLLSIKYNLRIFIAVLLNEKDIIPSIHKIFSSAIWMEREVFDMYGIQFSHMADNRRILTDYNFQYFPLRKDFPLTGYDEVRYDIEEGAVKYSPVALDQNYRDFDFESPWVGTEYEIKKP